MLDLGARVITLIHPHQGNQVIYYLAASVAHVSPHAARKLRSRLSRIAEALESKPDAPQAVWPHDQVRYGVAPCDLPTAAAALIRGLARGMHRTAVVCLLVDPTAAPTMGRQVELAKELGIPVQRLDLAQLAVLGRGAPKPDVVDPPPPQGDEARDVRRLTQVVNAYFHGADRVCGAGAIQPGQVGGGGVHRAREAQIEAGLQIAQAAAVFDVARRDPRWAGLSATGGGGASRAEVVEAIRRTDLVVHARAALDLSFSGCAAQAGITGPSDSGRAKAARRVWARAVAALRAALDARNSEKRFAEGG